MIISILVTEFLIYFIFSSYGRLITEKKNDLYFEEVKHNLKHSMILEMEHLDNKITLIEGIVNFLKLESETIFSENSVMDKMLNEADYAIHENGTLYSLNNEGASIYYPLPSSTDQDYWDKISRLRSMESSFINIKASVSEVEQLYFNSYDTMNILYPGISNSSEIFGNNIKAEDFVFYYLADKAHNPNKVIKWTPAYADPARAGWVLSCIAPVYKNDFLEGVTGVDISVSKLTDDLTTFNLALPYSVMILENNNLISYYDQLNLFESQAVEKYYYTEPIEDEVFLSEVHDVKTILTEKQYSVFNECLSGFSSPGEIVAIEENFNDEEFVIFKSTLNKLGWNYIFFIPKESLLEPMLNTNREFRSYLIFANVLLLLITGMVVMIATKITKNVTNGIVNPINELTYQSSKINLNENTFINLNTKILEIEILSDALNQMQEKINNSFTKMMETEREKEKEKAKNHILETLSYIDMLTGISNRRRIEDILDERIVLSKAEKGNFSILLLDIDFFKKVNDTFGHDVGDKVLIGVSQKVQENLTMSDDFGRWGGEEFVVICKNTGILDAEILANKLIKVIESTEFITDYKITMSIGVSEFNNNEDKHSLFERADSLLYLAKTSGRNNVKSDRDALEKGFESGQSQK